jgi:homoserine O-succinyltransferase
MFNHFEYDADTLAWEYSRDCENNGREAVLPHAYFPDDDPDKTPKNSWRSHAQLLYSNWINTVYQMTPFDLSQIGA